MIRFTVVIPVYNKEKYISSTLISLINQVYTNWEAIIINDGSTDDSLKKIASFQDERIKVYSYSNGGVSMARNRGINRASGEFVALLDADDEWHPLFLSAIDKAIDCYSGFNCFSTGRVRRIDGETVPYRNRAIDGQKDIEIVDYYRCLSYGLPPVNSSCIVLRRSFLDGKDLFNEQMTKYEDHDFWLRLLNCERIVYVNQNFSIYNKDVSDSLSSISLGLGDLKVYLETIEAAIKNTRDGRQYLKRYVRLFCFKLFLSGSTDIKAKNIRELLLSKNVLFSRLEVELIITAHLLVKLLKKW